MIYVYRPTIQTPQINFQFDLKSEIGGCLCFTSGTPSVSQVFFDKNQYYLGETARVRIITDNTLCDKDIKNFKFKLVRRYEGTFDCYR